MLAALATAAALAPTGTVAREGTELVYRSAPGASDHVVIQDPDNAGLAGVDGAVAFGAGCEKRFTVVCSLEGVTAIRVIGGNGDDDVAVLVKQPVIADLGPGDDQFAARGATLTIMGGDGNDDISGTAGAGLIDAGPGDDELRVHPDDTFTGPLSVAGGDGDDRLYLAGHAEPGISLAGGAGDDDIQIEVFESGPGFDISCGPGNDRVALRLSDRPGDGCAAHVTVGTPQSVARSFSEGDVTRPASVRVTYRRRPGGGRGPAETLALGTTIATASGPLRVRLKSTRAGRRWLKSRLKLYVSIRTRTGGDVNDYEFDSRFA